MSSAVDGHPRETRGEGAVEHLLHRPVATRSHHVDARHHDLAHQRIIQLEDAVDHLALGLGEHPALLRRVNLELEVLLGHDRHGVEHARGAQRGERAGAPGNRAATPTASTATL